MDLAVSDYASYNSRRPFGESSYSPTLKQLEEASLVAQANLDDVLGPEGRALADWIRQQIRLNELETVLVLLNRLEPTDEELEIMIGSIKRNR